MARPMLRIYQEKCVCHNRSMAQGSFSSILVACAFLLAAIAVIFAIGIALVSVASPLLRRAREFYSQHSLLLPKFSRLRRSDLQHEEDDDDEDLDATTATVLSMLQTTSILVDSDNEVVQASPAAYSFGLVNDDTIANETLLDAIAQVRADGTQKTIEMRTYTPKQYSTLKSTQQQQFDEKVTDQQSIEDRVHAVSRPNWLTVTLARLRGGSVIITIVDNSERKRFAELRDSFIEHVSHQLIEPTQALAQLADDIEQGGENVQEDARKVRSTSEKLEHMVEDLLLLMKAQEPVTMGKGEQVSLAYVVSQAVSQYRKKAERWSNEIRVRLDDSLYAYGQESQLIAAVCRLLDNALRYSGEGDSIAISLSRSQDGTHALIRVVDRGCGVESEQQSHIFERFYRGSRQTKRSQNGAGLGLAIVKHVAITHHGTVGVWSRPGQGSTFTLSLPTA